MMGRNLLLIGTILFVCLSCSTGTDGDGDGHDRTTVLGILNLFVDVWNSGDVEVYEDLLDEDFTFHFDPADAEDDDIPDEWGYDEEITAYTNLFEYVGAENVDVQLDLEGITEPEEGVVTYTVSDIHYRVRITVPDEDIIYLAEAKLDLELEKKDNEWVITIWWDIFSQRLLGVCTSWGEIKAWFS